MLLIILAFVGGVLTILSPCILPVIPFVFARADQPFRRGKLPMLAGMALTFALFAALATAGGNWIVRTNQYGRYAAMAVMAVLGLTLLLPSLAELLTRPLVRLGSQLQKPRLQEHGRREESGAGTSLILGASIGLLWAPCAGPILGLVLAAAAYGGVSARSLSLLLAFAVGAVCSLAVALLAGARVFALLKRGLGAEEWVRRGLGIAVLAGVAAIALGLDTRFLAAFSYINTNRVEQSLVNRFSAGGANPTLDAQPVSAAAPDAPGATIKVSESDAAPAAVPLDNEGKFPSLSGAAAWINSPPLTPAGLRGHVVLIDFWTYSCINCLRSLPYVEAWAAKYKDQGLVVIGVHSPEFAFERNLGNVQKAVKDLGVVYPVAVDSQLKIWNNFHNQYWPAHYVIDASGEIRYHHFGEGDYPQTERVLQELLGEAKAAAVPQTIVQVQAAGALEAADPEAMASPETYIGYDRAERFVSPQRLATDVPASYTVPAKLGLNEWGLDGDWIVDEESAELQKAGGGIVYRFHARDLHLVLGAPKGKTVRFKVTIDGTAPGANHGADTDAQGYGVISDHRLYQLVRLQSPGADHTFKIQFLDQGAEAFAFTFG